MATTPAPHPAPIPAPVRLTPVEAMLPDALYVHDHDGRFLAVNRQACLATGRTEAELLALSLPDVEADFDLPAAQRVMAAIRPGEPASLRSRHRRKDGTLAPVEVHLTVMEEEGGRRLYYALAHDVTERLRLERFEGVFDNCLVGIVMLSAKDQRIVDVNPAFERLSGYARDEVLGRTTVELGMWVYAEDRESFLRRVRSGEAVNGDPYWFRAKDGREVESLFAGRIVAIGDERYMLGQLVDMSALKAARDALAKERAQLQAIVDRSPNGLMMVGRDRRIAWHNERVLQVLEAPAELLAPGSDVAELFGFAFRRGDYGNETPEETAERLGRLLTLTEPVRFERRARGGAAVLEVECVPMPGGGLVVSYADVTERKLRAQALETQVEARTEELRRSLAALEIARDAAEAANQAKTTFLANMGHELRTPLNGILGMATLLKLTPLAEKQADYLAKIERSGRRLNDLLGEVLDLAQLESGRLPLASERLQLGLLGFDLRQRFAASLESKSLDWDCHVEPALAQAGLAGDPHRLGQVLAILVDNAIKFTDAGSVQLRIGHAGTGAGGTVVRFEVADTGIGIAPEDLPLLFQPFQQVDGRTTRRHGGAGLGLAVANRLVQLMGGEMSVESEPGRGSTFRFTARFAPAAREVDAPGRGG